MKDKILKEFDEKFNVNKHIDEGNFGEGNPGGWRTIAVKDWIKKWSSMRDNDIKQFLSKAIDQVEEEMIRKVEEMLPDEFDITENEALTLLNKIKQSLNKLKK